MITNIKILNRRYIDYILFTKDFPWAKSWFLISIYDYDDGPCLTDKNIEIAKSIGCRGMLSLEFSDVTTNNFEKIHKHYPQIILFDKNHANYIISFLSQIKKTMFPDSWLVVHCAAGISRSGAVGTFACDFLELNYNEFKRENAYIMPNAHILKILNEEKRYRS